MSLLLTLAQSLDPTTLDIPKATLDAVTMKEMLQIVFAILGAVCLLIITLAGLRFVISRGEPQMVQRAKMTILYAIVGLVIALAAFTIVTFVLENV